ncbi:MAG: hypothetical protein IKM34_08290 [Clostridia bacterium]|nr:hypothetical protein [Clostridia bacterium]
MNDMKQRKSEDVRLEEESAALPFFSSSEKEQQTGKSTFWVVAVLVVMSILLMLSVASAVGLNEKAVEISHLKDEIKLLEKQRDEYVSEMDKKNDMVAFEQYAINNLGMLKGSLIQNDDREDKIE